MEVTQEDKDEGRAPTEESTREPEAGLPAGLGRGTANGSLLTAVSCGSGWAWTFPEESDPYVEEYIHTAVIKGDKRGAHQKSSAVRL